MRIKSILLSLLACLALTAFPQPAQQAPEWEWYLDEVVNDTFVGRNYFEYYYTPSAGDIEQQRLKGEVSYFLNTPEGLNSKKVRNMIDRLMASYDDIKAVGDWHMTNTTYWKEFRYEKNKFRFSLKRKALEDGTYYVSITETAGYYKSLGKKTSQDTEDETESSDKPTRRSTRDRRPVVIPDEDAETTVENHVDDAVAEPVVEATASDKEQRKLEAEKREQEKRELRLQQRREQEKRREEAKAQREAEKQKKAEEKKQRMEEERLKKEQEKQQRQEQEAQRQQQAAAEARRKAAAASHYHYTDVALWLSEKYGFTQTAMSDNSCTMFSTAVKDTEMAKLAIKNALKDSDARMAVPWRLNSETQAIETGYTVDDQVLVFAIGTDGDGRVTLTITEVSTEQFELFKQSLKTH